MKPWLRWSLFGTLSLSAWALLFPAEPPRASIRTAVPLPPDLANRTLTVAPSPSFQAVSVDVDQLLADLPQPHLDAAIADPFVGVRPPPPPPPPTVAITAPPPPAPTPPALNYRFLGRVVDPDGQLEVYLSRADKDQLVARGTQLPEGYVVQAITPTAVELYYPPLDYHTQIRIPPDGTP